MHSIIASFTSLSSDRIGSEIQMMLEDTFGVSRLSHLEDVSVSSLDVNCLSETTTYSPSSCRIQDTMFPWVAAFGSKTNFEDLASNIGPLHFNSGRSRTIR